MRHVLAGALAASASVVLTGCGTAPEPVPTPAPTPAPTPVPPNTVLCPSANDTTAQTCTPGVCCPGFGATSDQTFPCPNSPLGDDDTHTCDCGRSCVVSAILGAASRSEKYGYVRGTGWVEYSVTAGYYIGNAGGDLFRYGVPSLNMHDSGNGFNNIDLTENAFNLFNIPKDTEQVTTWPVSLNLASMWSEDYASRYGTALAQEFRKKGANVLLGPAVETHRVPRGGRNAEYISGESPYLGARLVKPYIRAVQSEGVLASVKHFVGNQQETCRRESNSIIDARTRYEMYYPQFEAAMQADVAVVMCGYNQVNGDWNCGSQEILGYDLRDSLGFGGFVQSDWWAFHSFDMGMAGGVDQEMPGTGITGVDDRTTRYTDESLDTQTDEKIDSMVRPQLEYLLKYGLAEPSEDTCQMGSCLSKLVGSITLTAERQALAKEITTEAVTLLKNADNTLPLAEKGLKIAVLGTWCNKRVEWSNEWYARNPLFIGGSGRSVPKRVVTVLDSMTTACARTYDNDGVTTPYCTVQGYTGENPDEAIAAATGADVAFFCGEIATGEETDRDNLNLWADNFHNDVANGLHATMPVVALLMIPGPVVMPWINNVKSVMTIFAPGMWYGDAFVDNIFGYHTPSAKTPVYYPIVEEGTTAPEPNLDGCSQSNVLDINYTEGLFVSWHGAPAENVLFPFGHGLSYTSFAYSEGALTYSVEGVRDSCPDQDSDRGEAVACITAVVTNTGSVSGVEIAQLYMGFPGGLGEPAKVLRGFHRLDQLAAAATGTARFPIYQRDLQTYSAESRQWEGPHDGTYTFYVGANSADDAIVLTLDFPSAAKMVVV